MCILKKCFGFAVPLLFAADLNAQVLLPPTGAQPLATLHWSYFGGIRALATEMVFSVNYLQTASASIDPTTRVLASSWTPAMAGQSVIATANSEPNYARFVSLLTDGDIGEIGIAFGLVPVYEEQPWQYKMEPIAFSTRPANWNGVDLGGFTITAHECPV